MARSLFEGSRRNKCDVSGVSETLWDDCRRGAGAHGDDTSHCSFEMMFISAGERGGTAPGSLRAGHVWGADGSGGYRRGNCDHFGVVRRGH